MSNPSTQVCYDDLIREQQDVPVRLDRLSILATVIDADTDGIYFRDEEGVCRMANTSLSQMLGIPAKRIIGRCAAGLFPPETACLMLEQEEAALANGSPQARELIIETKHGGFPCLVLHDVLHDENSRVTGVFARLRDISERKRLEQELVEISEREMRRIGSDLHDDLCQELAAVSLIARLFQKKLAEENPEQEKIAAHIADFTRRLAVSTRNLVHNLAPPMLSGANFVEMLRRVAATICDGFHVQCGIEGEWPNRASDPNMATHLYRIAHEAMYNAAKHSGGNYITVRLRATQDAFTVYVSDNGNGFKTDSQELRGIGLNTMRYRAGLIGGMLKIDSAPGRGTTVLCKVPLGKKE